MEKSVRMEFGLRLLERKSVREWYLLYGPNSLLLGDKETWLTSLTLQCSNVSHVGLQNIWFDNLKN